MYQFIRQTTLTLSIIALTACASNQITPQGVPNSTAYQATEKYPDMAPEKRVPNAYWQNFCNRNPEDCGLSSAETRVKLTPKNWFMIQKINMWVNDKIGYRADNLNGQGRDKMVRLNLFDANTDDYGDCEDHAITKRHYLLKAGIPASALRLAKVAPMSQGINYLGNMEYVTPTHMVLIIATNKGDFVLDDAEGYVLPIDRAGYFIASFHKAVPEDPDRWVIADAEPHIMASLH